MSGLRLSLGVALLSSIGDVRAQDPTCDFTRSVVPGNVYTASGPLSGGTYRAGTRCRWIFTCPTGYRCRLDCPDIALPQSSQCSVDRLLVSTSGDPTLSAANYYCGTGSLTNVLSDGRQLSLALLSSSSSPGGRFNCEVRAVYDSSAPTCSCGYKKVNRIVGGTPTQPNEYPMMAGIVYVEQGSTIKCGATIISTTDVVTAAHCVAGRDLSQTAIVVGEHDVTSGTDTSVLQVFRAAAIRVYPQYNPTYYQNDIAVVKVNGTIQFSDSVGPVCLPFKYSKTNNITGAPVELLGWGTTEPGGPDSKVLRKVTVNVISQAQCSAAVPGVTSNKICTYSPGKDACQDDSGGPVLQTDSTTRRLFLVGIISYGRSCASDSPGINTYVPPYLDWIQNVAPASYCVV